MSDKSNEIRRVVFILFYPLLYITSILFSMVLSIRHFLYDKNILKSYHFSEVFTICVGNLNFGGSGKSPLTDYLISLLKPHFKIAVLSRGYGRKTKGFKIVHTNSHYLECGDEPLMYKQKHPDVLITVCEDRAEGIRAITRQFSDIQVIILDDAFQHRKIKADLNILVSEYSKPFFKDKIFPLGNLRDLKSRAIKNDLLVISKTPENTDTLSLQKFSGEVKKFFPEEVFFNALEYDNIFSVCSDKTINIFKELHRYNCILVTGIANPQPLKVMLKEYANYLYHLNYSDHYAFTQRDINLLFEIYSEWQKKYSDNIIITTEKDAVRIKPFISSQYNLPIFIAPIKIQFLPSSQNFNQKILDYVRTNSKHG